MRLVVLRFALVDRVAVFGAAFFAVVALVAPQHVEQPAFIAADLVVPFALGERFTLAFLAVVFLAAFGVVAINRDSSKFVDALFWFRPRR